MITNTNIIFIKDDSMITNNTESYFSWTNTKSHKKMKLIIDKSQSKIEILLKI